MEDIIEEFALDCLVRGYASRTVESYEGHVRTFLSCYPLQTDTSGLKHFLVHLRDERQLTLATVSSYFSSLSVFYDYLEYEGVIKHNPVPKFRKRYLRHYKRRHRPQTRQLITVQQMADLINEADQLLYQAIIIFLAKTGIRRNELILLDRDDVNLRNNTVFLKPTAKRSNRIIYFDDETKLFLEAYLNTRTDDNPALFVGRLNNNRIDEDRIYNAITRYAERCGFHNPTGPLHEKFTPHCCRHWFTTHMRRSGVSREFIQELRGDSRHDTIDIYDHIEPDELKAAYFNHIPQLGVKPKLS